MNLRKDHYRILAKAKYYDKEKQTIRLSEYRSRRAGNGCMASARRWFYVVKIHYVPEFVIAPRRGTAPDREREMRR